MKCLNSLNFKRAFFIILFLFIASAFSSKASAQVRDFYVANSGSDSNDGSQGRPWATIQHAVDSFSAGPSGTVIHVASGSYTNNSPASCQGNNPIVCISKSGASSSARLTLQCEGQWSVPSGSGCVLRGHTDTGIAVIANNVNVIGFDYGSNGNSTQGVIDGCYPKVGSGSCATGNNVLIKNNYIHDIAQTADDGAGHGPGCPANGAIFIGHDRQQNVTGVQVIGNRISNYGNTGIAPRNGGSCTWAHGIYASANNIIQNNVILDTVSNGIQLYSAPCNAVISNNTIVRAGTNGIQIAGGDCSGGTVSVTNNILDDNGRWGVQIGTGSGGECDSSHPILISSNITSGNRNAPYGGTSSCSTPVNQLTEAPSATFVNYQGNSRDDFHLKSSSIAVSNGTTNCVNGGSCLISIDFDGLARATPPSVGTYEAIGATVTIPLAPTGLVATVQ